MNVTLLLALFAPGQFSQPVYAQDEEPQFTILIEDDFDAPVLWAVVSDENYTTRFVEGHMKLRTIYQDRLPAACAVWG